MRARSILWTLTVVATAVAIVACDPFSPELGDTPFRCGTSAPLCPEGYVCVERTQSERLCIRASGPSGGADGGDDPTCGDDNGEEPNEDIGDPTTTPIPDFQTEYSVAGYAICPEDDVDTYRFRINVPGQNAKVEVMYTSANGGLQLDVLNEVGTPIGSAAPVGDNNDLLRAEVNNLPTGTYFAQVKGLASVRNSYDMTISLSGP